MLLGGARAAARSPSSPFQIKLDRLSAYIRVGLKYHFLCFAFSGQFEWMSRSRFKMLFSSLCPLASHSVLSHVTEDHPGTVPKMWLTERRQIRYGSLPSPLLPLTQRAEDSGEMFPPHTRCACLLSVFYSLSLPPLYTHALCKQMSGHPPKANGTGRP